MRPTLLVAVLILGLSGCAPSEVSEPVDGTGAESGFVLSSPDLDDEGYLPEWAVGSAEPFCSGENRSPQLEWTGAPVGTAGFAVTMTDPNYAVYTHWLVTGISANETSLASTPDGLVENGVLGTSGEGAGTGGPGVYVGPCVVDNGYLYTVYALDEPIVGESTTTLIDFSGLITDHVLATAELEIKRR